MMKWQRSTFVLHILSILLWAYASMGFAAKEAKVKHKNWERSHGYVLDRSTGDLYNSDDQGTVRFKSAALVLGNATINAAVNLPVTIVGRFFHGLGRLFSAKDKSQAKKGLKEVAVGVSAPLIWLGMEGAAVVGIFSPYYGRKYYQRLEKNMAFRLAPCFEPIGHQDVSVDEDELAQKDQEQHLLGVEINGARW